MDPRGARNDTRERAQYWARGATPLDPRGARNDTRERAQRRIRDDARDGLAAAAVSLGGSVGLTLALGVLLRWLG